MIRKVLFLFIFFTFLFSQDYVLVITNDSIANKESFKVKEEAKKDISKNLDCDRLKIVWFNIDIKSLNKNPEYVKKIRSDLKELLKKKHFVAVLGVTVSSVFAKIADILPSDIPVFTGVASWSALNKYRGREIFSAAPDAYQSRGMYILRLKKLLHLKGVVFILGDKDVFGKAVYNSIKDKAVLLNKNEINDKVLEKYKDYLIVVLIDNNVDSTFKFIRKKLNNKNLNLFTLYITSRKKYYTDIKNTNIYGVSYRINDTKNFLFYDYLAKFKNRDLKHVNDYDYIYRNYKSKLGLVYKYVNENNISKAVFKALRSLEKEPYIDSQTKYFFKFIKMRGNNKDIYYNDIYKTGLREKYMFKFSDGKRYILPVQIFKLKNTLKKVPVLYITPYVNDVKITSLEASIAEIDMNLELKYLENYDFNLQKDIRLITETKMSNNLEYSLVKTYKKDGFLYKIYRVKLFAPVSSDLFYFPYDKLWVNIEFTKNSDKNFLLFVDTSKTKNMNKQYQDFLLKNIYSTYSVDIVGKQIINRHYLLIELERFQPLLVILKYLLPAFIIFFIGLYVGIYDLTKNDYDGVGVVSDMILGVISVYFVFSLLISISGLVIIDIVFYSLIFILSVLLVVMHRHKYKKNRKNQKTE